MENHRKTIGILWENPQEIHGKSWGEPKGKPKETHGKIIGKSWENR